MSAARKFECRDCGVSLVAEAVREEALTPVESSNVLAIARNYVIVCPDHGVQIHQKPTGHHSTVIEADMQRAFPYAIKKHVRSLLSKDERAEFDASYLGRRLLDPEQFERWKALAASFQPEAPRTSS